MEDNTTPQSDGAKMLDPSDVNSVGGRNEDGELIASIDYLRGDEIRNVHNEDSQESIATMAKLLAIKQSSDKHNWRKLYLGRSFYLAGYVLYISLSFVLFSAIGVFTISENVLIALLTTMVANVLGVLAIAFYWLYQK